MSRLIILTAILAGCVSNVPTEAERQQSGGATEARDDIAAGHLVIEQYGVIEGVDPATSAFRLRYGIETASVGPCSVDPATAIRSIAYNRVMRAEIRRRFGAAVLARVDGP